VGPTIKSASLILPDITKKTLDVQDFGEVEPMLKSFSQANELGDAREIDGIQFWTGSKGTGEELAKRRQSLAQVAHKNSRATIQEENQ